MLKDAKVVYVPVEGRDDEGQRFVRTGIRIELDGGQWWFYSFRFDSFTRHRPGGIDRSAWEPKTLPERVDKFANKGNLLARLGHCRPLIEAIEKGIELALAKEAEARANR